MPTKKINNEIKGLFRAGAFLLAFFIAVAGFILLITSPIGILIWLIGFGWMTYLLAANVKDKQKSGFKTANIIMKIILMLFNLIFVILILSAR